MQSLREAFRWAEEKGVALGHFNVSDSTQFHAVVDAASELSVPIVIGVSEGERAFIGSDEVCALVRAAEGQGKTVFLNADHTYGVDECKTLIDAGYDSVIFDGAKLPVEENIAKTREVVAHARASGKDVMIEAELGYIGSSSKILEDVPDDVVAAALPSAEDAAAFVKETGIDAFAPAVGNVHGMLKGRKNPALDIGLIARIHGLVSVPLVLHGASGNTDDDIKKAVGAGISMVHVNTEIRVAYRKGIEKALADNPDEVAPYRYLNHGYDAVKSVVMQKLKIFNGIR